MADRIRMGLDEVVVHFAELEDPRSEINRRHPLVSVLVIALMAVLAGASGPTAIARWARIKEESRRAGIAAAGLRGPHCHESSVRCTTSESQSNSATGSATGSPKIPNTDSNSHYLRTMKELGEETHPARFPADLQDSSSSFSPTQATS